nr:transposase [uncultured Vibrio sp.]
MVIVDDAGWYTDDIANPFDNVIIIKWPSYSPELNPVEQVWAWLRDNELANRCFRDYEEIKGKLCKTWNRFSESTEKVISMCYRSGTELTNYTNLSKNMI